MTTQPTATARAGALGPHFLTGQFRCELHDESWWWSDEAYLIYGFAPGEVVPTTALIVAHNRPDEWNRARRIVVAACRNGTPFTSTHSIMDAAGQERTVVAVGQVVRDATSGRPARVQGYITDLTDEIRGRARVEATHQIRSAVEGREIIDRAKGVLALVYGMSADEAFGLLRGASNDRNVKVRDLAHLIVATATKHGVESRNTLDDLLSRRDGLTA